MRLPRFLLPHLLSLALGLSARADFLAVGPGVFRVNEQTGAYQQIGSLSPDTGYASSLTRDPQTNTFYTVGGLLQAGNQSRLFTLDPNTGNTTLVAPLSQSGLYIEALAFAPNGLLYATAYNDNTLYTIDPRTGAVAGVGSMGSAFSYVFGLAFAPNGTLYGYTYIGGETGPNGPGFFRLDPATATPTVLTPPGAQFFGFVGDIAFAPNGTLWASSGPAFALVDIQTGAPAGPGHLIPTSLEGMAFLPTATVPEPSTVLLLGAGLLGVFALRRRNTKP